MQEEEWLEQGGGLLEVLPALAHHNVTLYSVSRLAEAAEAHDLLHANHQSSCWCPRGVAELARCVKW